MQHRWCFEAVDRTLRDICDPDKLFGDIPTVIGGDFAKFLPVVKHGGRAEVVSACLRRSEMLPRLRVLTLTQNMRVRGADAENRRFIPWLQSLPYDPTRHNWVAPLPEMRPTFDITTFYNFLYPVDLLMRASIDHSVFRPCYPDDP